MPGLARLDIDDEEAISQALADQGACLLQGFPDHALTASLRDALLGLHASGGLHDAAVGRGDTRTLEPSLRGDATHWLDRPHLGDAAATAYLSRLDALRGGLNRRLFLGAGEVEAHYARYAAGTGYVRHRDRFRDSDARVVSLVSYLNRDWSMQEGGCLRLYLPAGDVDVLPVGGKSVCFLSEIEHEVLPATRERLSIAAWMRRGTSLLPAPRP